MRPLALLAGGFALVILDFRTEAFDLLPDPFGWILVALGASWLALPVGVRLAAITAALSLADLALPYHYVRIDGRTGEAIPGPVRGSTVSLRLDYLRVTGWQLAGLTASVVAAGVTLWVVLERLGRRAAYEEDDAAVRRLRWARWLAIGGWVVPYLATVAVAVGRGGRYDPVWNDGLEYLGLVGLAVGLYVVVVLATSARASWAQRPDSWYPSPWDERRLRGERRRNGRSTST
jgi:hypothetical protein